MVRTIARAAGERLLKWLRKPVIETLQPPAPERSLMPVVVTLLGELSRERAIDWYRQRKAVEMASELMEASMMGGSGIAAWHGRTTYAEALSGIQSGSGIEVRENFQATQGANGLFELEINNWDWRREINFSLLEFSRWGIQQIILICRLYWIKNPIVRRLVNVCAIYVFGRGVEVSSADPDVNEAVDRFMKRNAKVLGQSALTELERRKDYDGNLFFVFFNDEATGESLVRTIDGTEIWEIVTDPEDSDTPWFFHRKWIEHNFDPVSGKVSNDKREAWYPAIGYAPADMPAKIGAVEVLKTPVYHRKCGYVGKWLFGCPRIYPMLDWAKESRAFLEHCAAVKAALAQISMTITSKGGQQALAGIKQQLETTVGTGNSSWLDQNPTAVNGAVFAAGTGTTLAAFKSSGEGGDPEEVRQYKLMCCMVKDVPETFLGDVSTGNLATATTLDRPTELAFKSLQEEWIEDLGVIVSYGVGNEIKAPGGKLREALTKRKVDLAKFSVREANPDNDKQDENVAEIRVTFPEIREGDIPQLATALAAAFTTDTMDAKATALKFYQYFDIENAEELIEQMYPEATYDPDKTAEPEPAAAPAPPQPGRQSPQPAEKNAMKEAIQRLTEVLRDMRKQKGEKL